MKNKILFSIFFILLFLVIFFLQIYIIGGKTLFGVKPNLLLISVIVFTSFLGIYKGTIYSFFIGIICDFLYGSTFGVFTLSYVFVALVIGYISSNYITNNKLTLMLATFIGTAIFEFVEYIIYSFLLLEISSIFHLILQIFLASLLNLVIVFILNGVVQKIAEYFEIKSKEREAIY